MISKLDLLVHIYISISNIGKELGYNVTWNLDTKTITFIKIESTNPDFILVSGIYINEADQELKVGETLWLTTKVEPSNATNKKIIWKSSDDTIAEIDKYGRVTGIALGEVTITATLDIDNSKKANCLITVIPRGDEYAVIVDGISKNIISDGIIYEENNKLWAPLRFIGEGLNVEVLWDSNIREVVIIDGEIPIRINNQYSNIINDNAFWDVEYIGKELGYNVTWNLDTKTITFIKN